MNTTHFPLRKVYGRGIRIHGGGHEQLAHNTVTFAAGDVFANALSKSGPCQVTHLYVRYNGPDSGDFSPLLPNGGQSVDLKAVIRADFLTTPGSLDGGFYIPLLSPPAKASSNTLLYTANQLTYYFRIPGSLGSAYGQTGTGLDVSTSKISALGLAVAFDAADRTQDKIISVLQGGPSGGGYNFTMFNLVPGGQKFVDYPFAIDFSS